MKAGGRARRARPDWRAVALALVEFVFAFPEGEGGGLAGGGFGEFVEGFLAQAVYVVVAGVFEFAIDFTAALRGIGIASRKREGAFAVANADVGARVDGVNDAFFVADKGVAEDDFAGDGAVAGTDGDAAVLIVFSRDVVLVG